MESSTEHYFSPLRNLTRHHNTTTGSNAGRGNAEIGTDILSNTLRRGLEGFRVFLHRCCWITLETAAPAQGACGARRAEASAAVVRRRCRSSLVTREAMRMWLVVWYTWGRGSGMRRQRTGETENCLGGLSAFWCPRGDGAGGRLFRLQTCAEGG